MIVWWSLTDTSFPGCGESSRRRDREEGLEYGEDGPHGLYHTPKLGEENIVPVA